MHRRSTHMDAFRLPDSTRMGRLVLRVSDVAGTTEFYRTVIGLRRREDRSADDPVSREASAGEAVVELGTGARTLLELRGDGATGPESDDPSRSSGPDAGLYHLAFRVGSRPALARSLEHLGTTGWPLRGGADHGVSKAVYLTDPEGNGIEIYADRPRERWPMRGGELAMGSDPLDVSALLAAAEEDRPEKREDAGELDETARASRDPDGRFAIDPETRVGHVHLRVDDLAESERFYREVLGFEVTQRSYPGALFFAAGGYHHHVGVNVWGRSDSYGEGTGGESPDGSSSAESASAGRSGSRRSARAITPGLLACEIVLSEEGVEPRFDTLERLRGRLEEAVIPVETERSSAGDRTHTVRVRDPSGISIRIRA